MDMRFTLGEGSRKADVRLHIPESTTAADRQTKIRTFWEILGTTTSLLPVYQAVLMETYQLLQ